MLQPATLEELVLKTQALVNFGSRDNVAPRQVVASLLASMRPAVNVM
ncbi:MAG: hypothetical protein ACD_42C00530G0001 [uncultured bacterium]|nr:MAG: hypothetical protein ACD_42C00530G0001 [uncultured bacterium]